ncbi:gp67 [Mycobacterium phage Barnyard]|uniref:DUF7352 domain-containing protein n=1 Tax=Mycobacterium phage Barnyard TaxID=205880 RepID=Q856A5_9CAUD|nr:gp67 [Mycobacterium phage Barnyard]AAN02121.1 hypothetical protein PBI_BARNYARD_67 [Mycobacterium phage Barnyard]
MLTVYKYQLDPGAANRFRTKRLMRVVHVAPSYSAEYERDTSLGVPDDRETRIRAERINVWCLVDTSAEQISDFVIFGTGHPVTPNVQHVGTAVMPSGLIWHVFVPYSDFAVEQ